MKARLDPRKAAPDAMKALLGLQTHVNGCGLEQLRYLKSGDLVELAVEGIGVLRTRVGRAEQGGG